MKNLKELGKFGEERGAALLERLGMRIIRMNYRTPDGEIDIVAEENDVIVFVEVKLRRSISHGPPEAAVDKLKQKQLRYVARQFISQYQLFGRDCRFDVIAVRDEGGRISLKHIKNAFN